MPIIKAKKIVNKAAQIYKVLDSRTKNVPKINYSERPYYNQGRKIDSFEVNVQPVNRNSSNLGGFYRNRNYFFKNKIDLRDNQNLQGPRRPILKQNLYLIHQEQHIAEIKEEPKNLAEKVVNLVKKPEFNGTKIEISGVNCNKGQISIPNLRTNPVLATLSRPLLNYLADAITASATVLPECLQDIFIYSFAMYDYKIDVDKMAKIEVSKLVDQLEPGNIKRLIVNDDGNILNFLKLYYPKFVQFIKSDINLAANNPLLSFSNQDGLLNMLDDVAKNIASMEKLEKINRNITMNHRIRGYRKLDLFTINYLNVLSPVNLFFHILIYQKGFLIVQMNNFFNGNYYVIMAKVHQILMSLSRRRNDYTMILVNLQGETVSADSYVLPYLLA